MVVRTPRSLEGGFLGVRRVVVPQHISLAPGYSMISDEACLL